MSWFKRMFCEHAAIRFERNIYGDEINHVSLSRVYRSWWVCVDCGKAIARTFLFKGEPGDIV